MKKVLDLKDALEDNFVSQKPPRLFIKLSSSDGKREILTEVKHNSLLAKYFAEQSRIKSPALSAALDELYSQAESDSGDSGVAIGDRQRRTSDSPELVYSANGEGHPPTNQFVPQPISTDDQRGAVGYTLHPQPFAQPSSQPYHEYREHHGFSGSNQMHVSATSCQNDFHPHDPGVEPDLLERSYPNISGPPTWYGPPPGFFHPPPIACFPYYSMGSYPTYYPYSPAPRGPPPPPPGWPVHQYSPQDQYYQPATGMPEHREQAYDQAVSTEELAHQTVSESVGNGHPDQSPLMETKPQADETSDSSDSEASNELLQEEVPQRRYGFVVPSQAGEDNEMGFNFQWVELIPTEDKDSDSEYRLFARDSAGSPQQRSWSRGSRTRRFSGGSGSQLDMISEEGSCEEEQKAESEVSLTMSSDVTDNSETVAKTEHNENKSDVCPSSLMHPAGNDLMSRSLSAIETAKMAQRAALSSKSTTCLPALKTTNQVNHMSSPQSPDININHPSQQLIEMTALLGQETESHQAPAENQGSNEAHGDACKKLVSPKLSAKPSLLVAEVHVDPSEPTKSDVLSELDEREQSLLREKADVQQELNDMHSETEEMKTKSWTELASIQTAVQTEQEEFMKKMADLDDEERQLTKRLEEEKLSWKEKLQRLDSSEYDEITLQLNREEQRFHAEAESLKLRQKEIDDIHESIEQREQAMGLLRDQVTQMETDIDQRVKAFDVKSLEAEKEMARRKALIDRRELKPNRKLADLEKEIARLKQELGEVKGEVNQKSEVATQLESDAVELQQENGQMEGRVRALRSQLPVVLGQLEQYEKTRAKLSHAQNNSRSIVYRLVNSQPAVTPTLASASLLFDVTQLELSANEMVSQTRTVRHRRGSRLLPHDQQS